MILSVGFVVCSNLKAESKYVHSVLFGFQSSFLQFIPQNFLSVLVFPKQSVLCHFRYTYIRIYVSNCCSFRPSLQPGLPCISDPNPTAVPAFLLLSLARHISFHPHSSAVAGLSNLPSNCSSCTFYSPAVRSLLQRPSLLLTSGNSNPSLLIF